MNLTLILGHFIKSYILYIKNDKFYYFCFLKAKIHQQYVRQEKQQR